ncbi:MAG: ATP-binding protein [Lewinellaceae bacterium]|nr:ATP-binding protein [Lewinellaceae bacterium]
MSKIKINNFGPIKVGCQENDGWLEVKKVTVFIGNQGSGKSTVAKLISTFSWIEKALTRGDYDIKWFTRKNKFRNTYCSYHRLENYFFDINGNDTADLEYRGDSYSMKYQKGDFSIVESTQKNTYSLPQIMYVPAERNFISTVKSPKLLKLSSDSLVEFLTEFDNAKMEVKSGGLQLPINNTNIEYDKLNDIINIKGEDYKVRLTEASSGFQSVVPLYLVSWYLANSVKKQTESSREPMSSDELERFKKGVAEIWANGNLTDEQKRVALSVLSSKFNKTALINIVEEPEQNLFPSSQRQMLNSLLEFNNISSDNKLIITTHSPYIINFLSIAIQGNILKDKIENSENSKGALTALNGVVPVRSITAASDVAVYQLDEADGSIQELDSYEGIPSDENYLNQSLAEGNALFDSLLEIEQGL